MSSIPPEETRTKAEEEEARFGGGADGAVAAVDDDDGERKHVQGGKRRKQSTVMSRTQVFAGFPLLSVNLRLSYCVVEGRAGERASRPLLSVKNLLTPNDSPTYFPFLGAWNCDVASRTGSRPEHPGTPGRTSVASPRTTPGAPVAV